ncbi:hypothetical protein [Niabella beijingensis]|uniref:hypothetical protein n=1 Tax=Niabella beijingensis TaxID=2872700 RepID=UPI001CC03825|nr:hypothetical protein [Niabella beijingensis]MBZ4188685.1 hypothetical protein [Niabella beijingensis]
MKKTFLKLTAGFMLLSSVLAITGCKKEVTYIKDKEIIFVQPPAPVYKVDGIWVGNYTVDIYPELGKQYYSLILKPDGTAINETKWTEQTHISTGTWTMKGDTLICNTTCIYGYYVNIGVREIHTAIFDKKNGTMSKGKWKNPAPETGKGDIFIMRKED